MAKTKEAISTSKIYKMIEQAKHAPKDSKQLARLRKLQGKAGSRIGRAELKLGDNAAGAEKLWEKSTAHHAALMNLADPGTGPSGLRRSSDVMGKQHPRPDVNPITKKASMNKEAVSDAETATRVKRLLLSREQTKNEIDTLFDHSHEARKMARGTVDKLFVQADASQNQHPFMQKEAVAKHVTEFFEKKAHLTQAQRLFPELRKIGGTESQKQMVTKKPAGATATKPIISGDQQ